MPLFAESSVPGSMRNEMSPGVHKNTAPVSRPANASSNPFPGSMRAVATNEPSLNAATLLAGMSFGIRTHPIQVAVGTPPPVENSKTSIDSRPPWFVAYTAKRPFDAGVSLTPCRTASFGSSVPGQLAYLVRSGRLLGALAGYKFRTVFVRVSTRCSPLPGAIPLASNQRVFGTRTRSSGFWMPQMNVSPPEGVHSADWAVPVGCDPPMVIKASNATTSRRFIYVPRPGIIHRQPRCRAEGAGLRAQRSGIRVIRYTPAGRVKIVPFRAPFARQRFVGAWPDRSLERRGSSSPTHRQPRRQPQARGTF